MPYTAHTHCVRTVTVTIQSNLIRFDTPHHVPFEYRSNNNNHRKTASIDFGILVRFTRMFGACGTPSLAGTHAETQLVFASAQCCIELSLAEIKPISFPFTQSQNTLQFDMNIISVL